MGLLVRCSSCPLSEIALAMAIYYKFKNEKDFGKITLSGGSMQVLALKEAIAVKKNMSMDGMDKTFDVKVRAYSGCCAAQVARLRPRCAAPMFLLLPHGLTCAPRSSAALWTAIPLEGQEGAWPEEEGGRVC